MQPVNCKHWSPHTELKLSGIGKCAIGARRNPSAGACAHCDKCDPAIPLVDVILKNRQGAGDQVLLTGVVRDLVKSNPGRFRVAVDCWGSDLFACNPYITPREKLDKGARHLPVEGFAADQDAPHVLTQMSHGLADRLAVQIRTSRLGGDIHMAAHERRAPHPYGGEPYWIAWFGGHLSTTTKLWNPESAAEVVAHFRGRLRFVHVGAADHWHPQIPGAERLVGNTPMRAMVNLMYHAAGGIGPISFGMHLAAAVPVKPGSIVMRRPFVVLAGSRESVNICQYPNHTVLHSIGKLRCCRSGPCWKNHTQGPNVECDQPMDVLPETPKIARCMDEIKPRHVIDAIEGYLDAEEDARRAMRLAQIRAVQIAQQTRPVCVACGHHTGLSPAKLVAYCDSPKARQCCGSRTVGSVLLGSGVCPEGKWSAADVSIDKPRKLELAVLR